MQHKSLKMEAILEFLKKLAVHNDRDWMAANKPEYEKVREEFCLYAQALIDRLSVFDRSLAGLGYKDCVYRIHRDVRFSPDKRPYKEYFSVYVLPGGRNNMSLKAGYYLHIQPGGESLIAGGVHTPPNDMLKVIRKHIAANGSDLLDILENPAYKKVFGELEGEKLKKAPKDFPPGHEYIELLKLKSFDAVYYYKDDNRLKESHAFMEDIVEKFKLLKPLNDFFNEEM